MGQGVFEIFQDAIIDAMEDVKEKKELTSQNISVVELSGNCWFVFINTDSYCVVRSSLGIGTRSAVPVFFE